MTVLQSTSPIVLPDPVTALLAMLGAQPFDDAVVLGQSGPGFSPGQSGTLTALRIQHAYFQLLAVAPVWSALLHNPAAQAQVLRAFALHPWLPLLQRLLPEWCVVVADHAGSTEPDLPFALRCWQRLHDQHWQALALPATVPASIMLAVLPSAALPPSWSQQLNSWAARAGQLAARCGQTISAAEASDRDAVWQCNGATLYRYRAAEDAQSILLIYAWINHADVLDLAPNQSLIAALQQQGLAVWLLDWSGAGAQGCTLDQYLLGHLDAAVTAMIAAAQQPRVALLGICQGGTLALTYAAMKPDRIASLSLAVTPIDFKTAMDRLSAWSQSLPPPAVAALSVQSPGPLNLAFLQLKPYSLRLGKYLALLMHTPDDSMLAAFLRMEHWLMSGPLLSGPGLAQYLDCYYHRNGLKTNSLYVAGANISLGAVSAPVQLLIADHDHIVPPASSLALSALLPQPVAIERFATGHIGLLVGRARLGVAAKVAAFVKREGVVI